MHYFARKTQYSKGRNMPDSTSKSTSLTVRISPEIKEKLAAMAQAEHRSLTNMLEYLVLQRLKTHPVGEGGSVTRKPKSK